MFALTGGPVSRLNRAAMRIETERGYSACEHDRSESGSSARVKSLREVHPSPLPSLHRENHHAIGDPPTHAFIKPDRRLVLLLHFELDQSQLTHCSCAGMHGASGLLRDRF